MQPRKMKFIFVQIYMKQVLYSCQLYIILAIGSQNLGR